MIQLLTDLEIFFADLPPPILRQLYIYWLSVRQRVEYMIAFPAYKALNDPTSRYLSDDCQLVAFTVRHQTISMGQIHVLVIWHSPLPGRDFGTFWPHTIVTPSAGFDTGVTGLFLPLTENVFSLIVRGISA